jgi:flagella basal body P-ring formation protein FlgA
MPWIRSLLKIAGMLCGLCMAPWSANGSDDALHLVLRGDVETTSNVIRLRDLCQMEGTEESSESLGDLPLAPSPRAGFIQAWSRAELERTLILRGVPLDGIRWSGADEVRVRRAEGTSPVQAREASIPSAVEPKEFSPAFTTPTVMTQAERVVASAIEAYLQLKTGTDGKWGIRAQVPPQHAKELLQRTQIVSIAGGQPPWDGHHKFTLLVKTRTGEAAIDVEAEVRLPDMVVAAKGPLAKGRVLQESDLVWLALPQNSKITAGECFPEMESLIGKQLRRSVSTKQPFRHSDVGEPFAVQAGDMVMIAVLAGSVRVETHGRAVESGALDEIVQVDVLPQRKRLAARVVSERRVEVIANGAPSIQSDPRGSK